LVGELLPDDRELGHDGVILLLVQEPTTSSESQQTMA
jgi:hypothetical protein